MSEQPWWFPVETDAAWVERVRQDYPEQTAGKDDHWVRVKYADGAKYQVLWDHLGDAYEQFEALADAYIDLARKVPPGRDGGPERRRG